MSSNAKSRLTEAAKQHPESDGASPLEPLPPLIAAGQTAFRAALPELLKRHPGKWVAYNGAECVGFALDSADLYETCFARGLKSDEFVVRRVMSDVPLEVELTVPFEV